ncbi:TPA: dihydroorotate dehydrogenase [Candidatus Micrarchaeota archaeon]|nr:dihydroorotate dehydrogenase [Candidatus Micrarchaeota archaeon]
MAVDLSAKIAGIHLKNPTVLASGILGTTSHIMASVANQGGAGAITSKSASIKERKGHPNPIVVDQLGKGWFLNAVGLSNPGLEEKAEELAEYKKLSKTPIIASVFATTAEEFGLAAEAIAKCHPDAIELNESCPNVEDEFGRLFCLDERSAGKAVEEARSRVPKKIPIFAKLSPDVPAIETIARACVEAGADGITAVNTAGPGMAIDIDRAKPILANKFGGLSGPALKPLAIKCVYRIHAALPETPIIGTGGVFTGEDAIEMLMAGASAVGIGTSAFYRSRMVFKEVCKEMTGWMQSHGYKNARELIGKAHE